MTTLLTGEKIIAENIAFEDYLHRFHGQRVEYYDGKVIEVSPATDRHNEVVGFLYMLMEAYLEITGEGKVRRETITMRLYIDDEIKGPEPDIFVVATPNLHRLTKTYMDGPADLVIEVVSPDSDNRDRVKKFTCYEIAGVREYWIIDPDFNEALFYALNEGGQFSRQPVDEAGYYQSSVLSKLRIKTSYLLQYPSPRFRETGRIVDEMLGL